MHQAPLDTTLFIIAVFAQEFPIGKEAHDRASQSENTTGNKAGVSNGAVGLCIGLRFIKGLALVAGIIAGTETAARIVEACFLLGLISIDTTYNQCCH